MQASSKMIKFVQQASVWVFFNCLFSACATHSPKENGRIPEATTVAAEEPPVFQQTLKGHMAELGQYMDDVYRFWDSRSMHDLALERLDAMLEIDDRCLELYPTYLESHSIAAYRTEAERFENYLLRSRELTAALKAAVESKDDARILKAFGDLDQNRRDAHSAFGEAL